MENTENESREIKSSCQEYLPANSAENQKLKMSSKSDLGSCKF